MGEGEATRQKRKKKPKPNHVESGVAPSQSPHASKPLPSAPSLQTPTQSPAPGTPILEEAAAEAAMRERKIRKEQKVAALLLARNPTFDEEEEQGEAAVLATKKKHKERKSSPSLSAAETPILEQEAKVTKKRKPRKEPSGNSPLPLDPGQTQSQGTNAPHASKPLHAAPFLEVPAQCPAPGTSMLEEVAAEAAMRKWKMRKEQKVAALPLAQNPSLDEEEQRVDAVLATKKKKKHKERNKSSLSPPAAAAAETPILEQEAKATKKRKWSKEQEPSCYLPLPVDPGQTQPQRTNAPHASKPLYAAPFIEAPAQSPAPGTPMLEEMAVEAAMMKRKMCKEQKVAALPLAQNPSLEEQAQEHALVTKKKKHKERKSSPSPSAAAASETPILEQEAKVTKKRKQSKEQEPSGYSTLPLYPGQTQPQGTNAPHASKPLCAAPFIEAPAQSPAPGTPMLEEAAGAVVRKRKICKEQKVAAPSLAQSTTLEEQREDAMMAKMKKDSKYMELTLSSPSTSAAAETTIWEQEAKVTKKQKQRKQQEPYSKSTLPLDPGQVHCVRSQGGKAPLEQEQEADGRTGSSIKKNNGKRPRVRVLSKRELIKEASKKQPALPEGFVAFSDFVPSCTGQNPDHSPPYVAFFDQFRYNPVRGDHKPPLPRTPDRLSRLPPRGYPSFELSELSANGTSKPSKANNSVARKSKKKDSGSGFASGSQEKLHAKEKKSPEKKMRTKKQREPPPLLTRAEKCSDKYRRVPLDQLVPPARSPHNLLQEKYASDPWKVIVICMLLNLTQGKQVKNIIEGFFKCYPDPQSACNADPDKMAGYLAYLGLQRVKTTRIQRFSKEYVEKEWTYITELCGVGKYAADAYAIFCAGRATEVVPQDHKLVDYWKYICFELPMMQESQNTQEAGVLEDELAVIC